MIESISACKRCADFRNKYPLADGVHQVSDVIRVGPIRCAFEQGDDFTDNWSCQTMTFLRELAKGNRPADTLFSAANRADMTAASIGVVEIPEGEAFDENIQAGYIVLTWYKERGRTGQAWVMYDDAEPERLTRQTAEFVADWVERGKWHTSTGV